MMWEASHAGAPAGKVTPKVDVGPPHNMSGRYMIENATGVIYGIKGYGRVHKGHRYGTLATAGDWFWGGYRAQPQGERLMSVIIHATGTEMTRYDLMGEVVARARATPEGWVITDRDGGHSQPVADGQRPPVTVRLGRPGRRPRHPAPRCAPPRTNPPRP